MGLLSSFLNYSIEHIKMEQNKKADAFNKLASMTFSKLAKEVLVEVIQTKMIEERLYRRSYMSPWWRCVGPMQAKRIIKEVHEGSSGMHSGPRLVVSKIIRLGFGRPQIIISDNGKQFEEDTFPVFCKKLGALQAFPDSKAEYQGKMRPTWEGPYRVRKAYGDGAYKLETLSGEAIDQTWDGTNLQGTFLVFCKKLGVLQAFTSVYHPQANGQVEVTNREIVKDMERRLGMAHQAWVDELPQVISVHRTTPKSSNRETPFSLVYGSETVIPIEISVETKRVQDFDSKENEKDVEKTWTSLKKEGKWQR
nr:hypothetical protein [Tanacetum cinerariifolium]